MIYTIYMHVEGRWLLQAAFRAEGRAITYRDALKRRGMRAVLRRNIDSKSL